MKISQRLLIGFLIICLFVIISGLVGILYTNALNNRLNFVAEVTAPSMKMMDDMIISLLKNNNAMRIYASESSSAKLDVLRQNFDRLNTAFDQSELKIKELVKDAKVLANIETAAKRHREFNNKAIEMMNARIDELNARTPLEKSDMKQRKQDLLVELESITEESVSILDEVTDSVEASNLEAGIASFKAVKRMRLIIMFTTLISVIAAIISGILLSRSIVKPMNELSDAAAQVSSGNFTTEVKTKTNVDEMSRLVETFNQMTKSLKSMVEESPRMKRFLKLRSHSADKSFELELKNSYIVKEASARRSYELFLDKISDGYSGLCITRTHPQELKERFEIEKAALLWLSDSKDPNIASVADIATLQKRINEFTQKSVRSIIFFDRLDYLVMKYGFDEVHRFLLRINDKVATSSAIAMISIDPSTLGSRELSLLEKEFKDIPVSVISAVSEELLKIMSFINNQKKLGREITFKDIGRGFNITAPTTQKKLKELEDRKFIRIVKQGRNKLLELTKDGQSLVPH